MIMVEQRRSINKVCGFLASDLFDYDIWKEPVIEEGRTATSPGHTAAVVALQTRFNLAVITYPQISRNMTDAWSV